MLGGEGDRQIYLISQGNLAVPQWVDVNPQQIEPIWRPRQLTPDYVERMRLLNILPPEEFDHEYKGELQIKRGTQDDLRKACPNAFRPGNSAIGCTLRYPASCVIYIVNDNALQALDWDIEVVLRHERAYCNGWRHPQ